MYDRDLTLKEKFQAAAIGAYFGLLTPMKIGLIGAISFEVGAKMGAPMDVNCGVAGLVMATYLLESAFQHTRHIQRKIEPSEGILVSSVSATITLSISILIGSAALKNQGVEWNDIKNQFPLHEKHAIKPPQPR
ncbi:MAG: hypothetical protein COB76_05540 [Alphaproteobacteria bacterium]|nr:MAG: hypothetical protein COB76_05540 [Alphaproteobacteria bacterium]